MRISHLIVPWLWILAVAAGCAGYRDLPPGTVREVTGHPFPGLVEREVVSLSPLEQEPVIPVADFPVGPGDVLFVNIAGRPELGSPVVTGGAGRVQGSRVDGAGNIHLPLLGEVQVAGLTMAEINRKLAAEFGRYLNKPWVVVEMAEFRSQPLYLLGEFRRAGVYYLDRPHTLLQGLAMGEGLLETANLRAARLIRDRKTVPVDIRALLEDGGASQNVWLRPGDTIFVPDNRNQNVFVFGAVENPGMVPMPDGRLTLAQALASAGLEEVRYDRRHIRIIRSLSATRGELLVLDLGAAIRGEIVPYPLAEGDIVFVPRSPIRSWNEVIGEILPSLQAVSAVLQPFVQIKFLGD